MKVYKKDKLKLTVASFYFFGYIYMLTGEISSSSFLFCSIVVFLFLLVMIKEFATEKYINKITSQGKYIICNDFIEELVPEHTGDPTKRYRLAITYECEDNGKVYKFYSRKYTKYKWPFKDYKSVKVYVDLAKPKRYYVSEEVA